MEAVKQFPAIMQKRITVADHPGLAAAIASLRKYQDEAETEIDEQKVIEQQRSQLAKRIQSRLMRGHQAAWQAVFVAAHEAGQMIPGAISSDDVEMELSNGDTILTIKPDNDKTNGKKKQLGSSTRAKVAAILAEGIMKGALPIPDEIAAMADKIGMPDGVRIERRTMDGTVLPDDDDGPSNPFGTGGGDGETIH